VHDAPLGEIRQQVAAGVQRLLGEFDGRMSRKSSSRFMNASQRAWPSSMMLTSTRDVSGSSRPLSAAATACDASGIGPAGS
jgi:hypothetical protein